MEIVKTKIIGEAEVKKAMDTLEKYKASKSNLDRRIVENQQIWKKRYESILDKGKGNKDRYSVRTSWLHSCIDNKVADYMDNMPEPNILAKEQADEMTAKILSSIIPVILENTDFENVYYREALYKVMNGTGCFGCFWNNKLLNGLGDIEIKIVDLLNMFWEGGIDDIQNSPNLFVVDLVNDEYLKSEYPELKDKLGNTSFTKTEYIHDESISTDGKSYVVDWYYKKTVNNKTVLHYCKFVNGIVLYATENDENCKDTGLYTDGKYPFVTDTLFPIANSVAGYGLMDLLYNQQILIDKIAQALQENALVQATPRWLCRDDADVSEDEFADLSKHFIKVGNSLGADAIMPVATTTISGNTLNLYNQIIDEMKETSGNRDVSTGGTASGVTAASAISAMQEAGSKLSRTQIKLTYRAYKQLITMVIERIRQFYSLSRTFRIVGTDAAIEYVEFDNKQMQMQEIGYDVDTNEPFMRLPSFDVEVNASKASPYSRMSQNELAIQLFQLGIFNPQNADQSLALLDIMDIQHKDKVIKKVKENGTMFEYIQQMTQALDASNRIITEITGLDLLNGGGLPNPQSLIGGNNAQRETVLKQSERNNLGEDIAGGENQINKKAKQRVAESTSPV